MRSVGVAVMCTMLMGIANACGGADATGVFGDGGGGDDSGNPSGCPAAAPALGGTCFSPGLRCSYDCGNTIASCISGAWSLVQYAGPCPVNPVSIVCGGVQCAAGDVCCSDCNGGQSCSQGGCPEIECPFDAGPVDAPPPTDSSLAGCNPPCTTDQICEYPRPPGICPPPDSGVCPSGCPGCPPAPPPVPSCQAAPTFCSPLSCTCLVNDACGGCGGQCSVDQAGRYTLACNGC
jgi:hypothetical protein